MLWLCIRLPLLEPAVLTRLAVWAQQWSSHVSCGQAPDEPLLWLEIGASLRIFGGHVALRHTIAAALEPFEYRAMLAIAPTPQAARLFTQLMSQQDAEHAVLDLAALRMRLAPLRLELLALPAPAISALRSAGLRRIGEVLDLPASALAQRFGPATSEYLRRLCGEAPDPMPAVPFPGHYAGRVEFDGDLTDSVALLFPLQRLLWELQGYLRAADRALQTYTLRLEHHRHEDTELIMRCQVPSRDAAQLLTLARERLGVLALPAAVRALQLIAREFTAPAVAQRDFFARDNEHAAALHQTLDRVRARLGAHAVERMQLTPDYRPERAWRGDSAVLAEASATTRFDKANPVERLKTGHGAGLDTTELSPRPCWLLREPRALSAPPMLINGPERIESGWWDHADIARDYYLARADDGTRQWVFQDLRSGAWYLHGLWA